MWTVTWGFRIWETVWEFITDDWRLSFCLCCPVNRLKGQFNGKSLYFLQPWLIGWNHCKPFLSSLFTLLPSDNRYRSTCCRTTRLQGSFTPQTVRLCDRLFVMLIPWRLKRFTCCTSVPQQQPLKVVRLWKTNTQLLITAWVCWRQAQGVSEVGL